MEIIPDFNQKHMDDLVESAMHVTQQVDYLGTGRNYIDVIYKETHAGPEKGSSGSMLVAVQKLCTMDPPMQLKDIVLHGPGFFEKQRKVFGQFLPRPIASHYTTNVLQLTLIQKQLRTLVATRLLPMIATTAIQMWSKVCEPDEEHHLTEEHLKQWGELEQKSTAATDALDELFVHIINCLG